MKKNASRLLSLILCFAMLCGMLPSVRANAAEIETAEDAAVVEVLEEETPTETPTEAETPTEEPAAEEPSVEEPAAKEPAEKEPAEKEPAEKEPAEKEPAVKETTAEATPPLETTEVTEVVAGETPPVLEADGGMTLDELIEAMEEADAKEEHYTLTQSVTVDCDVTLAKSMSIQAGAVLTVTSGATLTLPLDCGLWVNDGSSLVVQEGGKLVNNGWIYADCGNVTVSGTYDLQNEWGGLMCFIRKTKSGSVTGISDKQLCLVFEELATDEEVNAVLARTDLGVYGAVHVCPNYSITLTTPPTDYDNVTLVVHEDYTATVSGEVDLHNMAIELENTTLTVKEGAHLTTHNNLNVYGTSCLQVEGELTAYGSLWIYANGSAVINGTVTSYTNFHVGYTGNGTLTVNGTLNVYDYLNIPSTSVMNVSRGGEVNILRETDENGEVTRSGFLDVYGTANVYGVVNDEHLLSVRKAEDGSGNAKLNLYAGAQLNVAESGNMNLENGGTVTVSGTLESLGHMDVADSTIAVTEGASVVLHGETFWSNSNMTGQHCLFHVGGPQFVMNGGTICLQDSSAIVFSGMAELNSGTIDLDDSVMVVTGGSTGINGDMVIDIDINTVPDTSMIPEEYVQGSFALEVCCYIPINDNAQITIDVGDAVVLESGSFNGILNNGTFHQMGGTVTVNQSKYIAMLTHGVTLVNGGTLNLSADIGYVQGYDFDRPEDALSRFFVNGGTVNATGNNIGILLNGPAAWQGGQVNAVATGDGTDEVTPQAVLVQRYTGDGDENVSSLTVTYGTHNLTSENGYGLSVDNAPVIFDGEGNLVLNAETPIYSLSDSAENTNFQQAQFADDSGRRTLTTEEVDGTYLHTLPPTTGNVIVDRNENASYLSFHWVDDNGNGSFENVDSNERGAGMAKDDEYHVVFFANIYENGQWTRTAIPAEKLVLSNDSITITPFSACQDGHNIADGQENGSCFVCMTANAWDMSCTVSYTTESEEELSLVIDVRRHNVGMYSSAEIGNDTWLRWLQVNPLKDNVYYLAYIGEGTIDADSVEVQENANKFTLEATENANIYKVTMTDAAKEQVQYGGFNIQIGFDILHEDGSTHYEQWGFWCDQDPTASYLSFHWVDDSGPETGYVENENDECRGTWMSEGDEFRVIFYANVWDEETENWVRTPIPAEDLVLSAPENVSITPASEYDWYIPAEGQTNGAYFVCMNAHKWDTSCTVSYIIDDETISMVVEVRRSIVSLYSSEELSNETWMNYGQVNPLKTNVYYVGYIGDGDIVADSIAVTENSDKLVGSKLEATNDPNVYKLTLTDEAVTYVSQTGGFNLCVDVDVRYDENNIGREEWDFWFGPCDMGEPDAGFRINDLWYQYFQEWDGFVTYDNPETCGPVAVELPENVSYNCETNTITLSGAALTSLGFYNVWEDTENNTSGSHLPSSTVNLVLEGENTITNDHGRALEVADETDLVISGSGSLYLKAINSEDNTDENGNYAFNAVGVWNQSSLTISGSAQVTAEIAGMGYYGDEKTTLFAIEGDWGGGTALTVCGNAALTAVIPDGARHDDIDDKTVNYYGIAAFDTITVADSAVLNTDELHFYFASGREASFNQTGGTVNLTSAGHVSYTDDGTVHYHYGGIGGGQGFALNVSGGELNIRSTPTEAEHDSSSYFVGIDIGGGTLNITGGTINITGAYDGTGISMGTDCDQGSTLKFAGGTLNFDGGNVEDIYSSVLWLSVDSTASFTGGSINADHAELHLDGTATWDGTKLTGSDFAFYNGDTFTMNSGEINLSDLSIIVFGAMDQPDAVTILNGGAIDLEQSVIWIGGSADFQGNTDIEIDATTTENSFTYGIAVIGELTVADSAKITINETFDNRIYRGILSWGTYRQTGGTVTVHADQCMGMLSYGRTILEGGVLDLSGSIGYVQGYDFERDNSLPEQVLLVEGGTLNASGSQVGILLNGPSVWNGGSVNASAAGAADNETATWPQAVRLEKFTGNEDLSGENVSYLMINDGTHTLTAVDTSGSSACSKGLSLNYAPVTINGGSITIDAEMAVYSVSDSLNITNFQTAPVFRSDVTQDSLTLTSREFTETETEGDYFHTLLESDGSYATKVTYVGNVEPMTQAEFEAALAEAKENNTDLVITRPVNLDSSVEVALPEGCKLIVAQGGEINLTNDMTLTLSSDTDLSGGAVLVNPGTTLVNSADLQILSEGLLTVEGAVNNSGNISNHNVLWIDNGGTVNVSGTLKNYQWMHVGYQNEEHSGAGAVTVTGTLTNYNYLRVAETGNLTVSGTLTNAGANEDYWPFIELHGALTVSGTLENSNFISVANEASFQITDGGQYAGLGQLEVVADTESEAAGILSGLDTSNFRKEETVQDDGSTTFTFWKDPDAVTQDVKDILASELEPAEKAEALQDMNTEELKAAMEQDPELVEQIAALEKEVAEGQAEVVVDEGVEDETVEGLATGASVTGAMLNVSMGGGNVSLVIGEAAEEHALAEIYMGDTAIQFSMDLTGVEDSENLSVPVQIKLPIPGELDPDLLVVLHFREDGGCENVQVNITYENEQWYVTFVVTGFSDFVMTQTRKGDCNLDGKIDINDAAELLWATIFEMEEDLPVGKLDFNGDERVDSDDVVYLLWHILFPDLFPLK